MILHAHPCLIEFIEEKNDTRIKCVAFQVIYMYMHSFVKNRTRAGHLGFDYHMTLTLKAPTTTALLLFGWQVNNKNSPVCSI